MKTLLSLLILVSVSMAQFTQNATKPWVVDTILYDTSTINIKLLKGDSININGNKFIVGANGNVKTTGLVDVNSGAIQLLPTGVINAANDAFLVKASGTVVGDTAEFAYGAFSDSVSITKSATIGVNLTLSSFAGGGAAALAANPTTGLITPASTVGFGNVALAEGITGSSDTLAFTDWIRSYSLSIAQIIAHDTAVAQGWFSPSKNLNIPGSLGSHGIADTGSSAFNDYDFMVNDPSGAYNFLNISNTSNEVDVATGKASTNIVVGQNGDGSTSATANGSWEFTGGILKMTGITGAGTKGVLCVATDGSLYVGLDSVGVKPCP